MRALTRPCATKDKLRAGLFHAKTAGTRQIGQTVNRYQARHLGAGAAQGGPAVAQGSGNLVKPERGGQMAGRAAHAGDVARQG